MQISSLFLLVLVSSTTGTRHHRHRLAKGRGNDQCDFGDEELEVFDHIFVNALDGNFEGFSQDLGRLLKHHRCAGREKEDILAAGRKAVNFFEREYGLDLSSVTDQDLLDGRVMIEDGNIVFHPFAFKPETKYRVISEINKRGRSFQFSDAPISHSGWVVETVNTVTLNGPRFNGTLGPMCAISTGEYMVKTGSPRHGGQLIFMYEARYPYIMHGSHYVIIDLDMYSDLFGQGLSFGVFEVTPGGLNGREVITFSNGY